MATVSASHAKDKSSTVSRKSYAKLPQILDVPNLIRVQLDSYRRFQESGLKHLLEEVSNKKGEGGASHGIRDLTGGRLELSFVSYEFRDPSHSEQECRHRGMTYSSPLYVRTRLLVKTTGEIKEQNLFWGDIPLMTERGTFIVSGAERVAVSQLIRSPGVYFMAEEDANSGRDLCRAKLIPDRGAWLEFETSNRDVISAKIDGKRKILVTTLLRAIGYGSDEQILSLFVNEDNVPGRQFIPSTIEREPALRGEAEALIDIYRKLRPNDPPNMENAKKLVNNLFFNHLHYDLGRVGRYKLNKRLGVDVPETQGTLTREDIVEIVRHIIMINNGNDNADDIDHLGNRRVRTVGELIQNQFRIGLLRLERVARERMSIIGSDAITPSALVNTRPVVAAITEFFNSSQLSQFMDQTNPLAELTHKRRLSAMGPGGLSRERAGFDVRDVHYSHYGRICPIETPEGPNIGLIGSLATYGLINDYGFIETPYRSVIKELSNTDDNLLGKKVRETVTDGNGTVIKARTTITAKHLAKLRELSSRKIQIVPFVSNSVEYLSADREDIFTVAQANAKLDAKNQFLEERVEARLGTRYFLEAPDKIDFMDVSSKQLFSVATSLIPFLEHDDANRALMGSNMQRQAVPLMRPEAPLVATGVEVEAAANSGQVLFAKREGVVNSVDGSKIVVAADNGEVDVYELAKFLRTNQGTCINQRPVVSKGDKVEEGRVLADSSATEQGELALGQNVLSAFMSWEGYNYEDAIIISNRLVADDKFSSIHIEKHETEARDTKLGPEEITRDIPNVGEESLRELDETGIIRIGAEVSQGDILVGKITPKGETELSAEEKLLRAIFGEKAREVKDTSLRVPHGESGKVIDVRIFSRDNGDELPSGVNERVQVWIAQKRRISVGDKLAGRHGNKGVISLIAPAEDMPFLPDGTPVDIILNPIGVPSRMNLGQVLEAHLGRAAQVLGFRALTPVFAGATDINIEDELARAWIIQRAGAISLNDDDGNPVMQIEKAQEWLEAKGYKGDRVYSDNYQGEAREVCLRLWLEELGISSRELTPTDLEQKVDSICQEGNLYPPISGKILLRDGRTGEPFDQPVTVGSVYIMKLIHLVEDKVHARSTGPYSLISQQPLGGKAQFGGQRFGEMEVWALEAYGAARNLQEMLTIKSDDVAGRAKTYEAIIKNEDIIQAGVPESFRVLVKELQSLGLAIEVISEEQKVTPAEEVEEAPRLEIDTSVAQDVTIAEGVPQLEPDKQEDIVSETITEPVGEAESPLEDAVSMDVTQGVGEVEAEVGKESETSEEVAKPEGDNAGVLENVASDEVSESVEGNVEVQEEPASEEKENA